MKNVNGKVVAIVGATGGIGAPLAEMFVAAGAKVLLGARKVEPLRMLRDQIDPSGQFSIALRTDASIPKQVTSLLQAGRNRFRQVDIVIVTVGTWKLTYAHTNPFEAAEAGRVLADSIIIPSWNAILETDQFLREHGGGVGINMSSHVVGFDEKDLPGNIYYRAAKVAVENVVESLRVGRKENLVSWVNLRPGTVDTPTNRKEHLEVPAQKWALAVQPKTIFDWIVKNCDSSEIPTDAYFQSKLVL